ncbi:MAG: GntR family transcriptional regulator [Coprococcus sp.]
MQKETLKERVYRGIYEAVTNGEYRPNDILTENQMIEKFGVSKSPVREALVELWKDGVLINIPRMGDQVRAVTLKEIMDILEFRVDVEVGGLRKSFPVLTRENINMLRMIAEKHNADEDRIVSNNWQRNYEFHTYLYSLNNNVYGHQALQQMIHQCSRYISQYFLSAWQRKNESNGRYHMAVVDALEKQNIEEACVYLEKDILAVKEEILALHSMNI